MSIFREDTVKVRGRSVRLYRGGSGPTLLFLHDSFCPAWLPLHDHLAAQFEVLVPVHPGFLPPEDDLNDFEEIEDLVFHYLDLCTALGLERPALAGASFGGWIAAEWAIRHGAALESLILIDALGLRIPGAPAADILSLDALALRRVLFGDPDSSPALEMIPAIAKPEAMESTILSRRVFARFAWQFPDNPRLQRYLYRITVPTLIVWGELDGMVTAAHGEAYRDGIAQSQLVILPKSGHLPHIEAAEDCARLMSDFLKNDGNR
jgi:pimeloyl-ACP methyl ester carboxylesterase